MNVYLVICPDAIIDRYGHSGSAVELVAAETRGKAKAIAHRNNELYLDFYGEYTDWRAKVIAKSVPMEQGLLPPNHPLWDTDSYEKNAQQKTWSNGRDKEDLRRASESYWNEWYSTFEVT